MQLKIKLIFLTGLLLIFGCRTDSGHQNKLSAELKSEERRAADFTEINAGNSVDLEISAQKDFSITVETNEFLLKDVFTEVRDQSLIVSTKDVKTPTGKIKVRISLPEIKKLEVWGASTAIVSGVKSDSLEIQVSGTSKLKIDGEAKNVTISAIGASTIEAENLKVEKADAKTTGSSNLTVFVSNDLVAEALGASNIFYLGEPKSVKPSIIGTSTIQKK